MTISRRHFLQVGAGTLAAAGLARCSSPLGSGLFLRKGETYPEDAFERPNYRSSFVPSLCRECSTACGVLLRVVDGRVVGIKGNPRFPTNGRGLCPKGPASLQRLYHPDRLVAARVRSSANTAGGEPLARNAALDLLAAHLKDARGSRDGIAILCGAERGLARALWSSLGDRLGAGPVRFWTPGLDMIESLARIGGAPAPVGVDLERCAFVLSLGSPLLEAGLTPAATMRAFGEFRRGRDTRGRFVQVEPRLSVTAAKADEWIPCKPSSYGIVALSLASVLFDEGLVDAAGLRRSVRGFDAFVAAVAAFRPDRAADACGIPLDRIGRLARELASRRPSAVVGWGSQAFPWTSVRDGAAVAALNVVLGAYGTPGGVVPMDAPDAGDASAISDDAVLAQLTRRADALKCLVIVGDDPVGRSSRKGEWAALLERVPFTACLALEENPTSRHARLVLPAAHAYESFQDARVASADGTPVWSVVGPAIQPPKEVVAISELPFELAARLGVPLCGGGRTFDECAQEYRTALLAGGFAPLAKDGNDLSAPALGLKSAASSVVDLTALAAMLGSPAPAAATAGFPLRLQLHEPLVFASATGAGLPYLLEVPDPLGTSRWDTLVEVAADDARELGLAAGDRVVVESPGGSLAATVVPYAGLAPGTVSMSVAGPNQNRFAKGLMGNPLVLGTGQPDLRSVPVRLRKGR